MVRLFNPEPAEKKMMFSVNLPATMTEEIDHHAKANGLNRQELIRQMLQHCLDDLVTTAVEIGGNASG